MTSTPPTVKFLTFNTWGLKFVSKLRRERLQAIADRISAYHEHYDVIAFQEIWVQEDWDYIERVCQQAFPYRRIFYSGILSGPGLAILSKVPIESTFLYRFPINGRPSAFFRGDWYVGKSVAVTLLKPLSDETAPLAILNSHMHAPYALTGDAAYDCHRACQAWDFSRLAKMLTKAGYAVVIVGDLNSRPGSLPHKFLTLETGFVDSWEQLNGIQDLQYISTLPPQQQIEVGGTTCDSILNTWRADRKPTEACRLDYALIDGRKLKVTEAKVDFTETISGVGSYSDHFAYTCTLQLLSTPKSVLANNPTIKRLSSNVALEKAAYHDDMVELIEEYEKTSEWQAQWRWIHFFASLLYIIIAIVVTSFTANAAAWSSVFWVLTAAVAGVTGVVDGLIALLFGRSEWRALQEVKHEVLDSKREITSVL